MSASDSSTCKEYLRPYLAELASTVCKDDVELCAECVRKGSVFLKDPEAAITQIISEEYRSNGERFTYTYAGELKILIWETQLKTVFPVIERYRSYFIQKYSSRIKKFLPIRNSNKQVVSSPEDVEIGILIYLVGNGNIMLSDNEYLELERFRDARNKLAHLDILDSETVDMILKRAETI